jgi:hypothetical protein
MKLLTATAYWATRRFVVRTMKLKPTKKNIVRQRFAQLVQNPGADALRQRGSRVRPSCRNFHAQVADFLLKRIAFHGHDLTLSLRAGCQLSAALGSPLTGAHLRQGRPVFLPLRRTAALPSSTTKT